MYFQLQEHKQGIDKHSELHHAVQQARELALEGKILLDETPPDLDKVRALAQRSQNAVDKLGATVEQYDMAPVSGWEKVAAIPLATQAAQGLWQAINQLQHEAGRRYGDTPKAANDDETQERWALGRHAAGGLEWAEFSPADGSLPNPGTTPLHAMPARGLQARYA